MNTSITQNDKQISKYIKKIFYKVSYFLSLESVQRLQKEGDTGNRNFSVPVFTDFFQQKYVYESAYRKKYS